MPPPTERCYRAHRTVAALTERGLTVHACARIAEETEQLTGEASPVVDEHTAHSGQVIVASGSNADESLPSWLRARDDFRFIFSSHVPKTSAAHGPIASGRARWMGWNVHPRLTDIVAAAEMTGARQILPAFLDLAAALGPILVQTPEADV